MITKNRLIDLIFEFIIENQKRCLLLLKTSRIVLSKEDQCLLVSQSDVQEITTLCSNQEEADTKVLLHAVLSLNQNPTKKVIIRSPSSDTDILVLALHLIEERARVYLDKGTGKNKNCFTLVVLILVD